MEQMQLEFWDNMGDVFGYDIIGSESHPLKKAFELYCKMMKDQETNDKEEEDKEDEDEETIVHMHGGVNADGSKWFEVSKLQKGKED